MVIVLMEQERINGLFSPHQIHPVLLEVSGISYRYSSNGWSNCISYVCTSYRNSVTAGENLFGEECEDEWTYLYVR